MWEGCELGADQLSWVQRFSPRCLQTSDSYFRDTLRNKLRSWRRGEGPIPTLSTWWVRSAVGHATCHRYAWGPLASSSQSLSFFGPTFEIFVYHSSRTYVSSPSIIPRLVRRPKDSCLSSNLCVKTMAIHYILAVSLFGIFAYGVSVRDVGTNRVRLSWDESNINL